MRNFAGLIKIKGLIAVSICLILSFLLPLALHGFAIRVLYPHHFSEYVQYYSAYFSVPEEVVYAVILCESGFDPLAVSRSGACGLMQLMPKTYRFLAKHLDSTVDDDMIFDPQVNICFGVCLLSLLYQKYGNWTNAFAAYNAGESAVDRWLAEPDRINDGELNKIPYKETADYVIRVKNAIRIYKKINN